MRASDVQPNTKVAANGKCRHNGRKPYFSSGKRAESPQRGHDLSQCRQRDTASSLSKRPAIATGLSKIIVPDA